MSKIETLNIDGEQRDVLANATDEQLERILSAVLDKRDAEARAKSPLFGATINLLAPTDANTREVERKARHNDFLRCLFLGPSHPKTRHLNFDALSRDLSSGVGTEGGYLTQTQFMTDVIMAEDNISTFEGACQQIPIMEKSVDWPTVTGKPTATWRAENANITQSDPVFGTKTMTPHSLDVYTAMPLELVMDSRVDLEALAGSLLGESIMLAKQEAFATGNGSGKPVGIDYSPTFGSVAQLGSALAYRDITRLVFSLPQQYRGRAVFVANNGFFQACSEILSTTGQPIFTEAQSGGGSPRLYGYGAIELPDIDGTGDSSDPTTAYFGVLIKTYGVGTRKDLEIIPNTQGDTPFKKNQVWIKAITRCDGQVLFTGAMKMLTDVSFAAT